MMDGWLSSGGKSIGARLGRFAVFCAVCCVSSETLFGSRSQIKRKTQGRISFLLKINFKILKAQKEEKSRVGSLLANRRTLCCQFRPFDNEVSLRK